MEIRKIMKEKWPYLYFFLVTAIIFSSFIFSDKMLFGSDTVEAGIMFRQFYADFVKEYHRMPLWIPYLYGGLPFVDAMHGDTFYPLAALQFFMPIHRALGYKLVITVFLAGIFAYWYLRKMKMSIWAAAFGGTAYMLSGFLVSLVYAGHDGRMYITSLLPLLLYGVEIGFEKAKQAGSFIARLIGGWWPFALAFALTVLANHPQFAYFAMWCVGAYFAMKLVFVYLQEKKLGSIILPGSGFLLGMAFGLAMSLVQILPTQDYVRNFSPRAGEGRGYEFASSWSLHAEEVISQIVPGFAGYSTLPNHPPLTEEQTYWGKNYFKINSEYAGLTAIILAVIGMIWLRDRFTYFYLGTAIFALLYALGDSGLIFKPIYYIVPLVNKFRAPSTIMFLFCFGVAFLAARAVDEMARIKKTRGNKKLVIIMLVIAGIYLLKGIIVSSGMGLMNLYVSILHPRIEAGQLGFLKDNLPNIAAGLFIGALILVAIAIMIWASMRKNMKIGIIAALLMTIAFIDSGLIHDLRFIRPVDPEPYFSKPQVVKFLESQPGPFRTFAFQGTMDNENKLAQFGIEEVAGYHGNQIRWYNEFLGGNQLSNLFSKPSVLALTNTKYLLSNQADIQRQIEGHPRFQLVNQSSNNIRVYENKLCLNRVRIMRNYEVIPNSDTALSAVLNPSYNFAEIIILNKAPAFEATTAAIEGETVEVLESPPDRIRVRANLKSPGLLEIQTGWYPYWKAYEGKKSLPIFRADFTFVAVELPPGEHVVELRNDNPKYFMGETVSLMSWGIFLAGLIGGIAYKKLKKAKAEPK